MTTADPPFDALTSVTGALVDANDRLLELITLTGTASTSLDEGELLDTLIEPTIALLHLDGCRLSAKIERTWGTPPTVDLESTAHQWKSNRNVADESIEMVVWRTADPFGTADAKLLEAIANLAGNAIGMARMHAEGLAQAAIGQEHAAAAKLASAALPDPLIPPTVPHATIWAAARPARTTGGDLFVWAELDNQLWFAVGDVSGKGLPAAVLMTVCTTSIETAIQRHGEQGPVAVLDSVTRSTHRRLSDAGMFLTIALGRFCPTTRTIEMANHGHSPIVFRQAHEVRRISATAPPIGVLVDARAELESFVVQPHDLLVIGTDGLTEQIDAAGNLFGESHFDALVASLELSDADHVGTSILATVDTHRGTTAQSDDQTLMVIGFHRERTRPLLIDATNQGVRALGPWLSEHLAILANGRFESRLGEIELAVHEIAMNIVDHALADAPSSRFALTLTVDDDELVAEFRDRGSAFGVAPSRPDPEHPQVGGYGLMIVEQLASRIERSRIDDLNISRLWFSSQGSIPAASGRKEAHDA